MSGNGANSTQMLTFSLPPNVVAGHSSHACPDRRANRRGPLHGCPLHEGQLGAFFPARCLLFFAPGTWLTRWRPRSRSRTAPAGPWGFSVFLPPSLHVSLRDRVSLRVHFSCFFSVVWGSRQRLGASTCDRIRGLLVWAACANANQKTLLTEIDSGANRCRRCITHIQPQRTEMCGIRTCGWNACWLLQLSSVHWVACHSSISKYIKTYWTWQMQADLYILRVTRTPLMKVVV